MQLYSFPQSAFQLQVRKWQQVRAYSYNILQLASHGRGVASKQMTNTP